jgi:hypothetical protein
VLTDWIARQNGDGGWAYSRGCSWTEPTAFVLLAQAATPSSGQSSRQDRESFRRGAKFLNSIARGDGGWSPQPGVEESTWVTALVALLPEDAIGEQQSRQAIDWLKERTGRESGWRWRLEQRLGGNKEEWPEGWPWFPGAAAWVIPTSLGILAFQRALRRSDKDRERLQYRVQEGKKFLLGRQCADGGWNHGSQKALGRDGDSYPETTGIALLALAGEKSARIERARAMARKHLASCKTAEGISWLRMGMAAQGEAAASAFPDPVCRTTMDHVLMALASAATNPLLA